MAKEEEDSMTGSRRSAILKSCMRTAEQISTKFLQLTKVNFIDVHVKRVLRAN